MAVYKYSMYKYLSSWSTWIILALSVAIAFVAGGLLPFTFFGKNVENPRLSYTVSIATVTTGITTFLCLFMSVFAGFKSVSMFKDEQEDGTLLFIVSKPVSRAKIFFSKYIALQTIMFIYNVITILFFALSIVIFDNFNDFENLGDDVKSLSSQLFKLIGMMIIVMTFFSLFFTSISVFFASFLPSTPTIGIAIGIGVIIPSTQAITMFASKLDYESVGRRMDMSNPFSRIREVDGNDEFNQLISSYETDIDNINEQLNNNDNYLNNLYFFGGKESGLESMWPYDFDYQLNRVTSIITERLMTDRDLSRVRESGERFTSPVNIESVMQIDDEQQLYDMFERTGHLFDGIKNASNDILFSIPRSFWSDMVTHAQDYPDDFGLNVGGLFGYYETSFGKNKGGKKPEQLRNYFSLVGQIFDVVHGLPFVANCLVKPTKYEEGKPDIYKPKGFPGTGQSFENFADFEDYIVSNDIMIGDNKPEDFIVTVNNFFMSMKFNMQFINAYEPLNRTERQYLRAAGIAGQRRLDNISPISSTMVNFDRIRKLMEESLGHPLVVPDNLGLGDPTIFEEDNENFRMLQWIIRHKGVHLHKIQYKEYVERKWVIIFYGLIGILLVPAAYFIFKFKNLK